MNNLQFDEGGPSITARRPKKTKMTFADRVIALGLAKTEAQANLYLIGFIVVAFGFIIYLNMQTFSTPAPVNFDDEFGEGF